MLRKYPITSPTSVILPFTIRVVADGRVHYNVFLLGSSYIASYICESIIFAASRVMYAPSLSIASNRPVISTYCPLYFIWCFSLHLFQVRHKFGHVIGSVGDLRTICSEVLFVLVLPSELLLIVLLLPWLLLLGSFPPTLAATAIITTTISAMISGFCKRAFVFTSALRACFAPAAISAPQCLHVTILGSFCHFFPSPYHSAFSIK